MRTSLNTSLQEQGLTSILSDPKVDCAGKFSPEPWAGGEFLEAWVVIGGESGRVGWE